MTESAVWICLSLVVFHYVGYPLLLFVLSAFSQAKSDFIFLIRRANRRCPFQADYVPRVALLMSVYNEEAVIRAKVKNLLETDYPSDRLEFLIGLDAPVDSTSELLSQTPSSRLCVFPFQTRRGKLAVLCDLAGRTSAEILVFTDANTMLEKNCIRNLVRHFAALAIRRSLFHPRKQSIVEDFQIPLEIRFNGYRVVYDPEAVAVEEIAPNFSAQFARRVRISAGNYQTLFANPGCLNPMKGLVTFCFFSHRVLRWFVPVFLLAAFSCSILLATQPEYAVLLAAQSVFYVMAGLGYWSKKSEKRTRLFSLPLSFCSMNFALLLGLFRYLNRRQTLTWKPTIRQVSPEMLLNKGSESR